MNNSRRYEFSTTGDHVGSRADIALHDLLPQYSRSFFQKLIKQGHVTFDGRVVTKPGFVLGRPGLLEVVLPSPGQTTQIPEELIAGLAVELIAEHPDFLVIAKPAGLVVHKPAHASRDVTLVDWVTKKYPETVGVGQPTRPGIVHRLDKQTSGLMIIARTQQGFETFTGLFKNRRITKVYCALVTGHPEPQFTVEYAIRRHPTQPTRMAHSRSDGKQAETTCVVTEYLNGAAVLVAYPKTGRTHQIRVHCAAVGHPIVGDAVYGLKSTLISRQALHAQGLIFEFAGRSYSYESALPADMQHAIAALRLQ